MNILNFIGNTPLVEIKKLNPNPKVKILAKLEYFNPGGSIKDRPALYMIDAGEKSGELTKDKIVLEATSGNTGIGLALVCSVKGYRLLLTMSEAVSMERQKILKARGAEIFLTPGNLGTDGAIEEVYKLSRENPKIYFMTDQFNNPANWQAHYFGTAQEILNQTENEVSMLIATMGTTGTVMGIARKLKEVNPEIKIIGVEPYLGHKLQGLKNMKEAYRPEIFEKNRLDEKINIEDEEAFEMTRRLAREEGIFVGMSSGAALAIAQKKAEKMGKGTIVVIFPDGGERYLSTTLFAVQSKVELKFFNSMTRTKESFVPKIPNKVSMYSCGPTAYDRMHLGECRRFVFADLLESYLEYRGYHVEHIINITDFDDKTINGSEKAGKNLKEFTEKYIELFKKDLSELRITPALNYPKVSEHLDDMVDLAKKLIQKGFAYEKLHSLYFDISRCSDYGKLSGIDINKIKIGASVDLDEYEKDNPKDFTLLKRSKLSELKRGIYVKTEWGNIRPSWHIQCAAIAMKYLGETFDIHTSSLELIFPHHENVLAVAKGVTGKPFAKFWMHCGRVLIDGKNLDSNNRLTLEHVFKMGYSGREIRYWLLTTHYRRPLAFSEISLSDARKALNRFDTFIQSLVHIKEGQSNSEINQILYDLKQSFITAMDDDLNISSSISSIFKVIKRINILISEKKIAPNEAKKIIEAFKNIDLVLKIFNFCDEYFEKDVLELIEEREKARLDKNWVIADKLRDKLKERKIILRDEKTK